MMEAPNETSSVRRELKQREPHERGAGRLEAAPAIRGQVRSETVLLLAVRVVSPILVGPRQGNPGAYDLRGLVQSLPQE